MSVYNDLPLSWLCILDIGYWIHIHIYKCTSSHKRQNVNKWSKPRSYKCALNFIAAPNPTQVTKLCKHQKNHEHLFIQDIRLFIYDSPYLLQLVVV